MSPADPGAATGSCCAPARRPAEAAGPARETAPAVAPGTGGAAAAYRTPVELLGGTFRMGSEDGDVNPGDGEGPVREVTVGPFALDAHAVTNARFDSFVRATGHRTDAEHFGWSYVFAAFLPEPLRAAAPRPAAPPPAPPP
ncbi:SUMF1/EgtB/PvdO family nonheme iron enzyme, partial [Streptomyces sp. NPDC059096]|uniref:SUMF1/EgtB/PvdO family nonheme iron enzyme n=1 Tax=Streptomyces sp. NPDC059096 TaxID=3346727 RepID=UPI0036C19BFA